MIEPTNSICLEWHGLSKSVSSKQWQVKNQLKIKLVTTTKRILREQSGYVTSGTMTALMGPSGAGKSTLLNCITGRIKSDGKITIAHSGEEPTPLRIALVPQDDALYGSFTVKETMLFATQINNASCDHHSYVHDMIADLDLTVCQNVNVSSLSGGQRKRLAIGVELVSNPSIIILDEPTTGLDSSNASLCMALLKQLAVDKNMAVVATIHQPSNDVFKSFDKLYLLSKYGQKVYFDAPCQLINTFAANGIKCPKSSSPACFALDVANCKFGEDKVDQLHRHCATVHSDSISPEKINYISSPYIESLADATKRSYKVSETSYYKQTYLLAKRSFLQFNVKSVQLVCLIICNIVMSIMDGLMIYPPPGLEDGCWNSGFTQTDEPSEARRQLVEKMKSIRLSAVCMFGPLLYVVLMGLVTTVLLIPTEILIVQREIRNNWYQTSSYFLGKLIASIPSTLLLVFIFYAVAIKLAQFDTVEFWRLGLFYSFLVLMSMQAETIGTLLGTVLSHDRAMATLLSLSTLFPAMFFSGFFVKLSDIPWYFLPISYISYMRYGFEGSMGAVYGFNRCSGLESSGTRGDFIDELLAASNPFDIVANTFRSLNSSEDNIRRFAPTLDVNVNDVLSVNSAGKAYFGESNYEVNLDAIQQPSYILYLYEVNEDMVKYNLVIMLSILFLFKLLNYRALVWKVR